MISRLQIILLIASLIFSLQVGLSGCDSSDDPATNSAPNQASDPIPADAATNQSINVDLSWSYTDPDSDPLTYDVHFGTSAIPPQVSSGQSEATYDPGTLINSQTYYWKIVAYDDQSNTTPGPIWSFTTLAGGSTENMVLVPAGPYSMGADYQQGTAQPIHTVNVPAFYIDVYLVTNAQYREFCTATGRSDPPDPGFDGMPNYFTNPAYAHYPVVNVSWNNAKDYAAWAGKRLPTEAEWERAAKGNTDNRQWPWGDTWVATNANTYDNPRVDGYIYTSPVDNYPSGISPTGCYDMIGNVLEWCEDDWHNNYTGAPSDGSAWIDNPRGYSRVYRSGGWNATSMGARCASRGYTYPATWDRFVGFRCAKTP